MSKPEKKATVSTGKTKDVVTDPQVRKAFGGKDDDTVISIKLPKGDSENVVLPGSTLDTMIKKHKAEKHPVVQPGSYLEAWVDKKGGEVLPIPENTPPTDRQIQNAERILKAAGRDMNRKLGGLTVNGVDQDPIDTDISTMYRDLKSDKLPGETVYLNSIHGYRIHDRKFNLFLVELGGESTYYFVDQESQVTINADGSNLRLRRHPVNGHGVLILINSVSVDDQVIGESLLVNADSERNLLNSSALISFEEPRAYHDYGLAFRDHTRRPPANPWDESEHSLPSTKRRQAYEGSQFKRVQAYDSFLMRGTYRSAHLAQCVIEGGGQANVVNSHLTQSVLAGTQVTLKNSNLTNCSLRSDGELLIKHSTFNYMHVSAKSVHILNKFSYLSLDTPTQKLYVVRANYREIDVGTSSYTMQRLKIAASEDEVRKVVAAALSVDEEGFPVAETSITRSFANYLTEAVMSRLKVIQLLDEAKQLVYQVGVGRANNFYDDLYAV